MPGSEIIVDVSGSEGVADDFGDVSLYEQAGDIVVDFDGYPKDEDAGRELGFDDNLLSIIDDAMLTQVGSRVCEYVDDDLTSRSEWTHRYKRGVEKLGLQPDLAGEAFDGGSIATHPLMLEAVVQYQARAMEELIPPAGPVKGSVIGQSNDEIEEQKTRVETYMNYQIMHEDPGHVPDTDRMFFRQAAFGSQFKKVFRDHARNITKSRFLTADEFIVPYGVSSLEDSPRYTHRFKMSANEFRKAVALGDYEDPGLSTPAPIGTDNDENDEEVISSAIVDVTPGGHEDDVEWTFYEQHLDWEFGLPEEEHAGYAIPYIVTVEKDSQKVIAVKRNWKEGDGLFVRKDWFVHYPFVPGLGFYTYGYVHLLGGIQDDIDGVLREIMDSASFSGLQGGFKTKDVRMPGNTHLIPGVYQDTDMTAEEMKNGFYTPPFREPPMALYHVLGLLVDGGKTLASIQDSQVGEGSNKGPVGTTLALIDQGAKIYTSIHRRSHTAAGQEFRLRAKVNAENLGERYPYQVNGEEHFIAADDFDSRVDVEPVSDPNISSSTMRIALAQTEFQLAKENPSLYDMYAVHKRLLIAIKSPNPDEILINPEDMVKHLDPVSENQLIMVGKPVRAFMDQDHQAHFSVHTNFIQHMVAAMGEEVAQVLQGPMTAHLTEHYALQYRAEMQQRMGLPLPPIQLHGKKVIEQELPAELEYQLASAASMVLIPPPKPPPEEEEDDDAQRVREDLEAADKIARKNESR